LKILCLTAPTATGKTALTLHLAKHYPIEAVSADSRQIYQFLNIGTAKPTSEELAVVPHHLIDFLLPNQPYSAGQFAQDASQAIQTILRKGKIPIIVGGTGFYIQALTEGIVPIPQVSPTILAELETKTDEEIYHQLQEVDPAAAAKIAPQNRQKLIRALSVYQETNIPFSAFLSAKKQKYSHYEFSIVWLKRNRDELYRRIDLRSQKMLDSGLIEETQAILNKGFTAEAPGLKSIGYKEVCQYLSDELPSADLAPAIAQATRRYAKRQITWLRHHRFDKVLEINDFSALLTHFKKCYQP